MCQKIDCSSANQPAVIAKAFNQGLRILIVPSEVMAKCGLAKSKRRLGTAGWSDAINAAQNIGFGEL